MKKKTFRSKLYKIDKSETKLLSLRIASAQRLSYLKNSKKVLWVLSILKGQESRPIFYTIVIFAIYIFSEFVHLQIGANKFLSANVL